MSCDGRSLSGNPHLRFSTHVDIRALADEVFEHVQLTHVGSVMQRPASARQFLVDVDVLSNLETKRGGGGLW